MWLKSKKVAKWGKTKWRWRKFVGKGGTAGLLSALGILHPTTCGELSWLRSWMERWKKQALGRDFHLSNQKPHNNPPNTSPPTKGCGRTPGRAPGRGQYQTEKPGSQWGGALSRVLNVFWGGDLILLGNWQLTPSQPFSTSRNCTIITCRGLGEASDLERRVLVFCLP